ncbi:hypothetical protein [Legionella sp.]|uniref:hypothetical protein n=1 Tax=Legionella sp. TaxID=459 RepID=UPI00257EFF5F|nr:hypothetical protein [Legionella sp.]
MYENAKLPIYQGIIQYLLDTTDYNLKRIAHLSGCSVKNIRSIYSYNEIPSDFTADLHLLRLYQIILESEMKYGKHPSSFAQRVMLHSID